MEKVATMNKDKVEEPVVEASTESNENETVVEEKKEKKSFFKKNSNKEPQDPLEKLELENENLKAEVKKLQNDYYMAYADAENIRKRQQRDFELSMKYRIQSFAESILPAIDNLERALTDTSEGTESYREGVEMIYQQILNALKQEGVVPIKAVNEPFDPNIHQALMMESVEGVEPNIVVEELQKGYMIKDRVLRASLVKVSQ